LNGGRRSIEAGPASIRGAATIAAGLSRRISTGSVTGSTGTLFGWMSFSTRIAKIRVGPVLPVRRDEAVEPGPFGSANLGSESADTDLACQQDG